MLRKKAAARFNAKQSRIVCERESAFCIILIMHHTKRKCCCNAGAMLVQFLLRFAFMHSQISRTHLRANLRRYDCNLCACCLHASQHAPRREMKLYCLIKTDAQILHSYCLSVTRLANSTTIARHPRPDVAPHAVQYTAERIACVRCAKSYGRTRRSRDSSDESASGRGT